MPRSVVDVQILELVTQGESITVGYALLDDAGRRVGGAVSRTYAMDDTATFSAVLGLTEAAGTVRRDAQGVARTLHDKVKDHHREFREWVRARIKVDEKL